MKKWLSLIVMTSLLLGAAYLAVATEAGRDMLNRSASTRAMLAEIDAMLSHDSKNPELLDKRAQLVENLMQNGTKSTDIPELVVKDAAYLASIGALPVQEQTASSANEPNPNEVKDIEYFLANGAIEDVLRLQEEQAATREAYLEELLVREREGFTLSESEKMDLLASGLMEDDSRAGDGRDHLDNVGGPDGFGYRWVDNLAGDTATYAWEDIVGAPGAVNLTAIGNTDDLATPVTLSFNFPFYGVNRTTIYPSTNGAIGMTNVSSLSNTCTLPTSLFPSGGIWPFWDDLHTGRGGTGVSGTVSDSGSVWYLDEGTRVIVQWDSVGRFSPSFQATYSFQAILYADGKIKLQYKDITRYAPSTTLPTATIGIQQGSTAPNNNYLTYDCATVGSASQDTLRDRAVWFYQLFLDNDFSCSAVLQPSPLRVEPGASMNIVGRFRNSGNTTQSSPVSYQFNGGAVVTEATGALPLNGTEDHDFAGTETAPLAVGDYVLTMWSDLANDEARTNDTVRVTILVRNCFDETAPNDAFSDAGTTCGAVNDFANTCLGSADASEDYIYQWTTTSNGAWNFQLLATTAQTRGLLVASSCPPDSFNCLASLNQFQDTLSINCLPLAAGTYYIMVDRSTGCDAYTLNVTPCNDLGRCCYSGGNDCIDNGAFDCQQLAGNWDRTTSCAAQPCPLFIDGGETCALATPLTIPATVRGTTTGNVDDDPNFQCESNFNGDDYLTNTAPDEWYSITGTGNIIRVSLCSGYTAFDSQLLVTCSADCQTFTCVGGNDDAFVAGCAVSSTRSVETFCSELGRTYYIVVDGFSAGNGNFELIITDSVACANPVNCSPLGRCCYLNLGVPACTDNLPADCATLGGQWNDLASCTTDPCPVGRCCYDDNGTPACGDFTDLQCQAVAGVWTVGLICAGNPCPIALQGTDSCYNAPTLNVGDEVTGTTASFTVDTVETCGTTLNSAPGVWYKLVGTGDSLEVTTCAGTTFGYDTKVGVFCGSCDDRTCVNGDDDATCTINGLLSRVPFCSELGREYYILVTGFSANSGPYTLAVNNLGPCNGAPINCTPFGRCCYLDNGAPACVDNLAAECTTLGGQWDITVTCATEACPVGRCCYVSNGFGACETNTELECNVLGGTWNSTTTCEATPCPIGRCCYDDAGTPGCVNEIEEVCNTLGGLWNGTTTCEATACPTPLAGSDLCVDAVLVPALNQQYLGSNVGATPETGLPTCATWYGTSAPGVWYKLIGTGNTMTISLCDPLTSFDTEIGVFCHPHCDSLVCVTTDDDFCTTPIFASEATFCSVLGAEYKLLIAAFSTSTGSFAFTVSDDGVACVPTVVCPLVVIPCDPVVDLSAYVATVGNFNDHLRLQFTAPQDATYIVWSTTNPNNDGNPDEGADPDWTIEATLPNLLAGTQTWDGPIGFPSNFRAFVVTGDCTP